MKQRLLELVHRPSRPEPWAEGDNIPWNEPGFSARMLREHLSQEHDHASRRGAKIDRQVAWIHAALLRETPSRVLDLGCGPGLYSSRLAALGHRCRGVDFSPASIRYARERAAEDGSDCAYVEGDLRQADFGDGHDLAMLLYGELNVFAPDDARLILGKARAALRPGGLLLLEPHPLAKIAAMGAEPSTWWTAASGLFAETPHVVLTEHGWHADRQAATARIYVVDAATGDVERHAQTFQGYDDEAYRELLASTGFDGVRFHASLTGRDEEAEVGLVGITARVGGDAGRGGAAPADPAPRVR